MRRALLLLTGLSLFGLTVAVASSFDANTEDLTTFSTEVSISVPEADLPPEVYLTTDGQGGFALSLIAPLKDNTNTVSVKWSEVALGQQDVAGFYVAWKSPPAPASGYRIQGNVALYLGQDQRMTDRMTAALLSCPPSAADASTTCSTLAQAVADVAQPPATDVPCTPGSSTTGPPAGNGFKERRICFGNLDVTVPAGQELRLKIVNQGPASMAQPDFRLSFGYNPARPSRLVTL
jgi:hypothetical protein